MDIALSNNDIKKLTNNKVNIITYPNLYKYKTIDEVLGEYGACIILFESRKHFGHWCLIFKQTNRMIEFFNPYNGYPDDSLNYIDDQYRIDTNQDIPYLSLLLIKSNYDLSYNEFQFQQLKRNINTCGRHCVVRFWLRNLTLYEYNDFIRNKCIKMGISPDKLVTLLTKL